MKKYSYLLLDWDGCLADTLSVWMDSYMSTFKEYNLSPTEKEIVDTTFGAYRGPIKLGITEDNLDDYMNTVFAKVNENITQAVLHKGVKETLDSLKGKVRMCVVTSSERHLFEKALKSNNHN